MGRKKSKKWLVFVIIIGVIVLLIVGKKLFTPEVLTAVTMEKPAQREIVELISANGRVQPVVEVKISPDVSGEIVELLVKEGDYVEKGQLLLKIKPDTYLSIKDRTEAAVNSSKAQLAQIEAQLAGAEQTYERQKQLFEQKAISASEFERAESEYNALTAQKRTAQFNIKSSEASLKEADEQLYKTTIFAPSAGTISKLSVELGERVVGTAQMAGTEMLRLADLKQMEVRADVNENDIVRVQMGDSATIEIDAYIGRKFKGVVTRIANSSQSTTSSADQVTSFEVRIYLDPTSYADLVNNDSPSPFRPGMSAAVDIETERLDVLSIPIQAITTRAKDGVEKKEVVFVYHRDSSVVHSVAVSSGIQDKQYIEITSGLDSTMQVVTGPFVAVSKELTDGQKVKNTADEPKKK